MTLGNDAAQFFESLAHNSNTKGNRKAVSVLVDFCTT